MYVRQLSIVPEVTDALFFFFSLFLSLSLLHFNSFYCCAFKFTDLLQCPVYFFISDTVFFFFTGSATEFVLYLSFLCFCFLWSIFIITFGSFIET